MTAALIPCPLTLNVLFACGSPRASGQAAQGGKHATDELSVRVGQAGPVGLWRILRHWTEMTRQVRLFGTARSKIGDSMSSLRPLMLVGTFGQVLARLHEAVPRLC
jgi:hypothetical protein